MLHFETGLFRFICHHFDSIFYAQPYTICIFLSNNTFTKSEKQLPVAIKRVTNMSAYFWNLRASEILQENSIRQQGSIEKHVSDIRKTLTLDRQTRHQSCLLRIHDRQNLHGSLRYKGCSYTGPNRDLLR
jgi:hypothetical protein